MELLLGDTDFEPEACLRAVGAIFAACPGTGSGPDSGTSNASMTNGADAGSSDAGFVDSGSSALGSYAPCPLSMFSEDGGCGINSAATGQCVNDPTQPQISASGAVFITNANTNEALRPKGVQYQRHRDKGTEHIQPADCRTSHSTERGAAAPL